MPVKNRSIIDAADLIASVTTHIAAVISNIETKIAGCEGVPLNVSDEAELAAIILSSQNDRLLQILPVMRSVKAEVKGLHAELLPDRSPLLTGQPTPRA